MKMGIYFGALLMLASLSLSSCSSEENEKTGVPQGEARLQLILTGKPTDVTRSTGAALPTADNEKTIGRVAVAIFDKKDNVVIIQEFTKTDDIVVNCTPGENCTGVVVANAPANYFAGITTKKAFLETNLKLTQTKDALPMSGAIKSGTGDDATTTFTLKAGETSKLNVELSRLVARVSISSIKTDFETSGTYAKATFKLKKIFLHRSSNKSTVDPAKIVGSDFLTGKLDAENAGLQTAVSPEVEFPTTTEHTGKYWFYTFAHTSTQPTKLVLYGSFDIDGTGTKYAAEDVYYPVVINKLQAGTTINDGKNDITVSAKGKGDSTVQANATYAITAKIKGKGVADPDDDIDPAIINLTVTVADWSLTISQDVTFN